jgi:hypothetical protein
MDRLVGDNLDNDRTQIINIFWKFYYKDSIRGRLYLYISNIDKKFDDGKRVFSRFFIFRRKDNTEDYIK